MNLVSPSWGGDSNQDGQEGSKHPDGDNHDMEEDKDSQSGANKEKKEENVDTVAQSSHALATESPPLIVKEMEEMFLSLGFIQVVAQKLVED